MARVKLSEFRAKNLLVDNYQGVSLSVDTLDDDLNQLVDDVQYVVKVDQGIKKRGKQGLIKLNVASGDVKQAVLDLSQRGFNRFVAEPMLKHDQSDERYVSFERTRGGIMISYSDHGGVDVEDHADDIVSFPATEPNDSLDLPNDFIDNVITIMNRQHLSFVEINPLVVQDGKLHLLDAAVLADSAAVNQTDWQDSDIVQSETKNAAELAVVELQASSPASFSFRILNPNGSLWLLLSGGGASITLADEAANQGRAEAIGNYGEYSGGPTTQETYIYSREVIRCLLGSDAPKKALVIAGGVANFTDVRKTFDGVIRALKEFKSQLQSQDIQVFVRRGGPHEVEGLAMMQDFLEEQQILGSVHGSDAVLTTVINEALEYIDA